MPKRYSSKELIRILEADGWFLVNVEGSHYQFKHPIKKGRHLHKTKVTIWAVHKGRVRQGSDYPKRRSTHAFY